MEENQNKPNITILTEVDYKYIIIEIIRSSSMLILFIIANVLIFGDELKKAHFNKSVAFIFVVIFIDKIAQKITNQTKTVHKNRTNRSFSFYSPTIITNE